MGCCGGRRAAGASWSCWLSRRCVLGLVLLLGFLLYAVLEMPMMTFQWFQWDAGELAPALHSISTAAVHSSAGTSGPSQPSGSAQTTSTLWTTAPPTHSGSLAPVLSAPTTGPPGDIGPHDEIQEMVKACGLPPCIGFHERSSPRLFVLEHTDGAGHRMKNIYDGMAVAVRNKMNFGGVVGQLQPLTDQHVNFRKVCLAMFGPDATDELFFYNISYRPPFVREYTSLNKLEQDRATMRPFDNVYIGGTNEWDSTKGKAAEYYPTRLREMLRAHLDKQKLIFEPNMLSVAMHLRRADLKPGDARATPDKYYFRIAEQLRKLSPEIDVHVWLTVWNIPAISENYWQEDDFAGYRNRSMKLHFDKNKDEDVLFAWAHLARAQVLVMSQSSFSYVPAILNTNCVIFVRGLDKPLENWMKGTDEDRGSYNNELKKCLAHAGFTPGALRRV